MTGHRIVPVEATEEMLQCSYKVVTFNAKERGGFLYVKMLTAAPPYEVTDEDVEVAARAMFECYWGYNPETIEQIWLREKHSLETRARKGLTAFVKRLQKEG